MGQIRNKNKSDRKDRFKNMKDKLEKIGNNRSEILKKLIRHKQTFEIYPDDDFSKIEKVLIELLMNIGEKDNWIVQYKYENDSLCSGEHSSLWKRRVLK
jgi:hypothetical protein